MAFYHCVHGKYLFVVVFVGPCPFCCLLCFSAAWRNAYLAGGSAFRLLWCFCLWLFCVVDLPYYMTTGVNVDFILNCFFTCKDRALERDRPYQREKKASGGSNPRWSASKIQDRRPAERQRARTKKKRPFCFTP